MGGNAAVCEYCRHDLPTGWEPNGKSDGRLELRYEGEKEACVNCRILIDPGADGGGPIQEWRDVMAAPGSGPIPSSRSHDRHRSA